MSQDDEATAVEEPTDVPAEENRTDDAAVGDSGQAAVELPEEVQELLHRFQDSATAGAVFGEPIERTGRTVVPIARVGLGFGGGSGSEADTDGGGIGLGGGLMARPVGALEVTDQETRFVSVGGRRRTAMVAVLAFFAGWILARALGGRTDSE